jgi:hypothetical protein
MYFSISQTQYLIIALFGGLLVVLILAVGFFSFRLSIFGTRREEEEEEKGHEFPDGLREGHNHVPLFIIFLTAGILLWGILYVLAITRGWIHVQ